MHFFDFGCCFLQKHSCLSRTISLHQGAAPGFHSHGYSQWFSKATKPKFHRQFPKTHPVRTALLFLFSLLAVIQPLLSTQWMDSTVCQQLCSCHVSEWGSRSQSKPWEPCPSSQSAAAVLPHLSFVQNIASSFSAARSQPLHISVPFNSYFLPPSVSLLSSSCVSGVSLGKTLNLKGLLNNLSQPCTQEIKPFCTFSIYQCVLQPKVLLHTQSLQPFGDWLHHLREVQVNFHFSVWTLCLKMWARVQIWNTNCSERGRTSLHGCQSDLSDKQKSYQMKT